MDMTVIPLPSRAARPRSQRSPLCRGGQGQLFGDSSKEDCALWRGISFLVAAVMPSMFCAILGA